MISNFSFWRIVSIIKILVRSKTKKYPKVISDLDTSIIISDGKLSVSRFGDGEIDLIAGTSIKFQEYNLLLQKKLKEILISDDDNLIICIPNIFSWKGLKNLTNESLDFWLDYNMKRDELWNSILNKKKIYYDASVSRPYIRNKNKEKAKIIFHNLRKTWDNKDVLIVEGKNSKLGVGNDLFDNANSISRLLCPGENAFLKYNEIFSKTLDYSENKLIIIALGPTATVLSADLNKNGKIAIDLGHIDLEYEWFLKKAKKRIEIEGKAVNELDSDGIKEIHDANYENEIVYIIE